MAILKKLLAYSLCDSLGMKLTYDANDEGLHGSAEHTVNASGLRFDVSAEVVSSWLSSGAHAVLVKLVGNLAVLAIARSTNAYGDVDLYILNLAKMDQAKGWFEKEKPATLAAALKRLDKAIVASFVKVNANKWAEA